MTDLHLVKFSKIDTCFFLHLFKIPNSCETKIRRLNVTHGYFDRNRAPNFLSCFTRIFLFVFEKKKFCKKGTNMDPGYQLSTGKHYNK